MRLPLVLLPLLLLTPGCLQLTYSRVITLHEPDDDDLAKLVPGESDLDDCLELLGAPLGVFEIPGGMALSYGWQSVRGWKFQASMPVVKHVTGRLSYSDTGQDIPAILGLFDTNCTLTEIRRGNLRELTARLGPRRPQLIE